MSQSSQEPSASGVLKGSSTSPIAVARSLDALVRSLRLRASIDDQGARRVVELWRSAGRVTMVLKPEGLEAQGQVLLDNAEGDIRWLLPAFMAGLRSIAPRENLSVPEMRRLGEELARVESDPITMERFRDWLWGGGAVGFDAQLQTSFMEVFDAALPGSIVAPDGFLALGIAAVRAADIQSLGDDLRMLASADIDTAATREEFDAPLGAAPAVPVLMNEAQRVTLAWRCDEPQGWDLLESLVIVAHRPLQSASMPEALSRRLSSVLAARFDPDALDLLASCVRRDDPYPKAVMASIDAPELGRAAVAQLPRDNDAVRVLGNLLLSAAPALRAEVAHELLARAAEETEFVLRVGYSVGDARFFQVLDAERVSLAQAQGLAVLLARGFGGDHVGPMVPWLSVDALAVVVGGIDAAEFERVSAAVVARAGALSAPFYEAKLAGPMLRHGRSGALAALSVTTRNIAEASAAAVVALARALSAAGLLALHASALVRQRAMSSAARLALLGVIDEDPAARAAMLQWNPRELIDPGELKAWRAARRGGATP